MYYVRTIYRTSSVNDTIKNGVGTCIEQVALMNYLCKGLNLKTKMYCTRIYEPDNYNDTKADEHMHCFLLVFMDNKVYHIEHPNWYNIGIFEYKNEKDAIEEIQKYYINLSGGINRPLTEFYDVEPNLTFQEFNKYINNLTEERKK